MYVLNSNTYCTIYIEFLNIINFKTRKYQVSAKSSYIIMLITD